MSTQFTNRQWRLPNNENKDKQSNYSMDFDGSQYIDTGDAFTSSTSFSISVWFKSDNTAAIAQAIVSSRINSIATSQGLDLNISSNTIYARVFNNGATQVTTSFTDTTSWHHIVITYNSSTLKMYLDGVSQGSATGVYTNSAANWLIGKWNAGSYYFNGQIDGVAIYNYALSASQVTTLYGSSSTGIGNPITLNPVAYYPLGDQDAFNGSNYLVPNSSLKDYVFSFSGSLINFSSSINLGTVHTISYWGQVDYDASALSHSQSNVSSGYIIQHSSYVGGVYGFRPQSTAGTTWGLGNQSVKDAITKSKNGEWVQFTLVRNGNDVSLYADGVFLQSANVAWGAVDTIFSSLGGLGVCKYSNFLFWTTNLSSTEVATLYNNGSPIQTLSSIPQSSNVQGWWKLDASATYDSSTTTWTIEDSSTNSNDGTSSGMTQANLVQSDLSFTSGYSPYALDFDAASGDEINTNYTPPTGASARTISIWFNPDTSGNADICGYGTSSVAGLFDIVLHGGNVYVHGYGAYQDYCKGAYTVGAWNHYVITYDGTTAKGYVNNVATPENTVTLSTGTTNTFKIGNGYYNLGNFTGKLSNCSIWNAALTSAQVSEIYNEGVPSNLNNHSAYSNLVSWWQLGSNSSFNTNWTVLDEKGSNNGTSSNMTEDDIVDGVGSYANGLSSGMGGDEVVGDAPYSTANSLSVNMDVLDRVTDTPS